MIDHQNLSDQIEAELREAQETRNILAGDPVEFRRFAFGPRRDWTRVRPGVSDKPPEFAPPGILGRHARASERVYAPHPGGEYVAFHDRPGHGADNR